MPAEQPGPDAGRVRLAQQQAALLAALVAKGRSPEGFDPERLRVQAQTLRDKRRRVATAHLPEAAAALGADLPRLFAAYAATTPRPPGGGAADAAAFAAWLRRGGLLPLRHHPGLLGRLLRRPSWPCAPVFDISRKVRR